jgi:N12 class adenine-specific DNA methylase
MGEAPEEIGLKPANYPDSEDAISDMLATHEGREQIRELIEDAGKRLASGEAELRWHYVKKPDFLLSEIADLDRERREFPLPDKLEVKQEDFITAEEIDYAICQGSGMQNGLFRIYDYFLEGHDTKDNVKFLKDEYGDGGISSGLPGNNDSHNSHDAKGIRLEKGSYVDPYVSILLNWKVVEKRIRGLVAEDRYLSPEAKIKYAAYKEQAAENARLKELERFEREARKECRVDIENTIAEKFDGFILPRNAPDAVIEKHGIERVSFVLANSLSQNSRDGYFSQENIEWAKKIVAYPMWENHDLAVAIHPAVLNGFIDQARRYFEREKVREKEQEAQRAEVEDKEDFLNIDTEYIREKLENGEADRETDAFLDFARKVARESEAEPDWSEAVNFHITDDSLGTGSAKEKFRRNIEAIRLLEQIEGENRFANPEEQKILSNYVGWGGLSDAFDETKSNWSGEYRELKELLSPEEYRMARESTLNAHYTSPAIIRQMYKTIENMGFSKGNILEPAMGTGNFFGMLPENMQESRLYGVELDNITGRIAKLLYPQAEVQIKGFEKTNYPNDFFDVAIGNVPFGQYKVADKAYDRNNFLIHDYFFAKTLDKVRPGGVVAFVTSKGTMDKASPEVRRYLAQRADLLGAVRLPNTAFKANAGTEVTADILFFQKRDRMIEREPDWVYLSENADGITMNSYFAEHPEQIVGKMEMVSGPFGMESTCRADDSRPFEEQLSEAMARITGTVESVELEDGLTDELSDRSIPADPEVRNFSYTISDGEIYYRENSVMKPVDVSDTLKERIRGMVEIRNCTQELIEMQLENGSDAAIREKQEALNKIYDDFSAKFGLISSRTNKRAFNQDSSYCLLCSLEKLDDEGNFRGKADMFTKRTIKKAEVVTSVDTASEALAVSLSEKAKVDLDYMSALTGKDIDDITDELRGVIFQNPVTGAWQTADEYLSGNVREKLEKARIYAENHPEYAINVQALTQIQPKALDASEIEVRIGATWIEPKYIEDFMRDILQTPGHLFSRNTMAVQYSDVTGEWNVKGKNADYGNSLATMTYGTGRVNAYKILEDSLNLKDTRVYDTIIEEGKEKRVLNKKETTIASQKQEAIREAFKGWIFQEPERRKTLVAKYNELFNSTRPREYDGSHLKFAGMTPDIELKPHQKNAVAHVLYGENTLLAHCVGAGKTFEMTAAAMESKRLGLCRKSLFVVPNHLTEQWASDFLRLYPGANILAATKKDFEPANRKKFCSRIATGDYDAVIIGHSQFEKIPLSVERQSATLENQIEEISFAIEQAKAEKGERYTIKQMEKSRKSIQARLDKLNDQSRKDNVVTFEQLGVDRLFVDESHNYKNCAKRCRTR